MENKDKSIYDLNLEMQYKLRDLKEYSSRVLRNLDDLSKLFKPLHCSCIDHFEKMAADTKEMCGYLEIRIKKHYKQELLEKVNELEG